MNDTTRNGIDVLPVAQKTALAVQDREAVPQPVLDTVGVGVRDQVGVGEGDGGLGEGEKVRDGVGLRVMVGDGVRVRGTETVWVGVKLLLRVWTALNV